MIQTQEETDLSEHFGKWLQVKLKGIAELEVQQKFSNKIEKYFSSVSSLNILQNN